MGGCCGIVRSSANHATLVCFKIWAMSVKNTVLLIFHKLTQKHFHPLFEKKEEEKVIILSNFQYTDYGGNLRYL